MVSSLIAFGAYQRQHKKTLSETAIRIASSMLAGFAALSLIFYIMPHISLWRGELALAVFVSFVSIMSIRLSFMKIMSAYDLRMRVLILGAGKTANLVKQAQAAGELDGLNIVNFMPMPGDLENSKGIGLVNTQGALAKYVAEKQVDVIVLAMDERRKGLAGA